MHHEISERFNQLARESESQNGLAEGALILAAEARPDVDIETGLESLAELVERSRLLVETTTSASAAVEALNHSIFDSGVWKAGWLNPSGRLAKKL